MPDDDKDAIIARLLEQRKQLLCAINTGIVNLSVIVYKDHGDPRFDGWMRMMGEVHANPAYRDDPLNRSTPPPATAVSSRPA